jgi:hypothetical protein
MFCVTGIRLVYYLLRAGRVAGDASHQHKGNPMGKVRRDDRSADTGRPTQKQRRKRRAATKTAADPALPQRSASEERATADPRVAGAKRQAARRPNAALHVGHVGEGGEYLGESAPAIAVPTWKRRLYIDRPADLEALAAELAQARIIAIDAEFSQVRRRGPDDPSHRLALLQLAADNDYRVSYVVDAQRLRDLSPLQAPFASPNVLKVFHGIGSDARMLAARGLVARNTLDLEAVSRSIFGQHESGLQSMLQRAAGIRLDKSLQRADWSRRPLTPAMVAYAARDAEMTFVLYGWLTANYPWAIALHETLADEPPPAIAVWALPYLDGARPRPAAVAVAEAGLAANGPAQEQGLREALAAVRHPNQRARIMRLITDLELVRLAPDLRPYLTSAAADERAGAARAIGRLHDRSAILLLRPLLHDPVQDVRQAAHVALDHLDAGPSSRGAAPHVRPTGPVKWTSDDADAAGAGDTAGWRAALRARFGIASDPANEPLSKE